MCSTRAERSPTRAETRTADYVASWNGVAWKALGPSALTGAVHRDRLQGRQGLRRRSLRERRRRRRRRLPGGLGRNEVGRRLQRAVRRQRHRAPDRRLDPLRRRHLPERRGHPLRRLPGGVRPEHRRRELDGRHRRRLQRAGVRADRRQPGHALRGRRVQQPGRHPGSRQVAAFSGGAWRALGSGPGPGGGAITDFVRGIARAGRTSTSARTRPTSPASHRPTTWRSGTAPRGARSARTPRGADGWFPASTFINALTTSGARVFAAGSFQNAQAIRGPIRSRSSTAAPGRPSARTAPGTGR